MELENVYDVQVMKLCALIESSRTSFEDRVKRVIDDPYKSIRVTNESLNLLRGVLILAVRLDLIDLDEAERITSEEDEKYLDILTNLQDAKYEEECCIYGR